VFGRSLFLLSLPSNLITVSGFLQSISGRPTSSGTPSTSSSVPLFEAFGKSYDANSSNRKSNSKRQTQPRPIDPEGWPMKFPAQELCSKCGLCETSFVRHVTESCAFLDQGMQGMDRLEETVHGRPRRNDNNELRFGILHQPIQLVRGKNMNGAQWTGATTSIALAMLETNQVDAVVCVAQGDDNNDDDDWSLPNPIIARSAQDVLRGRGVKPSLSPNLRVLDEIQRDDTIQRLLFCGVGCSVQAFRAVQHELNLNEVYILGTNCADNAPTPQAANEFIEKGMGISTQQYKVEGYEFMQDYRVHVKLQNQQEGNPFDLYRTKPYFSLPASVAEPSIAPSCRHCFDYTNGLADVVIGYMGAPIQQAGMRMDDPQQSQQTLTVRNARGAHMVQTALQQDRLWINPEAPVDRGNHESTAIQTVLADTLVQRLYNDKLDLPSGMPEWLGNALASALQYVGPKGLAFARYSIDYHILRNYFHVLHHCRGDDSKALEKLPSSSVQLVEQYLASSTQLHDIQKRIKAKFES